MPEETLVDADYKNLALSLGKANDLFLLLGNYLFYKKLIKCTPQHFAHARIEAESTAWDKVNVKEVSLIQIYKELAYVLHLTNEEQKLFMAFESKLEWMLLRKIPDNKVLDAELLNDSKKQESLSYNQLFKEETLKIKKIYGHDDLVRISQKADLNNISSFTSKFETEDPGFNDFLNMENTSDLFSRDLQIIDITPSRYENILNNFKWTTGGLSSAMAGASKIERLSRKAANLNYKAVRDLAAGLIAPTLVSYVLWLLNRANDKKIKRLYFYSSNGRLLYNIAEILNAKLQMKIELQLLSASKNINLLSDSDTFALVNVFDHNPQINFLNSLVSNNVVHPHLIFCFYSENETQKLDIRTEGYLWDASKNIGYKNLLNNLHTVVEAFFLPQKTGVIERKNIGIENFAPDGPEPENIILKEGEGKLIYETVISFTENLFISKPFINYNNDMRAVVASLIKAFGRNPTETEAKVWNTFYKKLAATEKNKNIAEPYQLKDIFDIIFNGKIIQQDRWNEGSFSLTPKPLNTLIKVSAKIGSGIKKYIKN